MEYGNKKQKAIKTMRVILLQDIENLGKKYDIKEVSDGYARNFLLKRGLVKPATKGILKWVELQKELAGKKAEKDLEKIQEEAGNIDGQEVVIQVKVGNDGQLFESIGTKRISEKLKELGFEVKRTQVNLAKPIKELGEFPIKIIFPHNLEAEIKIIIAEEK
jgi:large subunit ribosomal protein L9